jgi:hypothetical protein
LNRGDDPTKGENVIEISAQIESDDVRLVTMRVSAFDGFVKAGPTVTEECDDGSLLVQRHLRRVLSDAVVKRVQALRTEVSRAVAGAGIKTDLGTLVTGEALCGLRQKERQKKAQAAEIRADMIRELEEAGEEVGPAKCEVTLTALRLTPDEEFRDALREVVDVSVAARLDDAVRILNEKAKAVRHYTEVGDARGAHPQLRAVFKVLAELRRCGWPEGELAPLRADAERVRDVVRSHEKTVADKLAELDGVGLMGGVRAAELRRAEAGGRVAA